MKFSPESTLLSLTVFFTQILIALFAIYPAALSAQPSTQSPPQLTLEGTLTMFKVTLYGDSLQEIDRYRRTTKEGEYVAFILKTDKKLDMTQYLKGDELAPLIEYGETMQSEFLMVQDFESGKPFSGKGFRGPICQQAGACDRLVVLPNGRLAERHSREDGLHQGGGGGVICIVRLFTFKR